MSINKTIFLYIATILIWPLSVIGQEGVPLKPKPNPFRSESLPPLFDKALVERMQKERGAVDERIREINERSKLSREELARTQGKLRESMTRTEQAMRNLEQSAARQQRLLESFRGGRSGAGRGGGSTVSNCIMAITPELEITIEEKRIKEIDESIGIITVNLANLEKERGGLEATKGVLGQLFNKERYEEIIRIQNKLIAQLNQLRAERARIEKALSSGFPRGYFDDAIEACRILYEKEKKGRKALQREIGIIPRSISQ